MMERPDIERMKQNDADIGGAIRSDAQTDRHDLLVYIAALEAEVAALREIAAILKMLRTTLAVLNTASVDELQTRLEKLGL